MRGSGGAPGRKVLLLLAGGWPFTIEGYVHAGRPVTLAGRCRRPSSSLRNLANTANLLDYTIYPMDVPGIPRPPGTSATTPWGQHAGASPPPPPGEAETLTSDGNPPLRSTPSPSPGTTPTRCATRSWRRRCCTSPARPAAGRCSTATAEGPGDADEDTHAYYWLGFTPAWQRDSRGHRIEVESLRPGVEVRARRGYLDLSRHGPTTMMKVEGALLFGDLPEAEPLAIRLGHAGQGERRPGHRDPRHPRHPGQRAHHAAGPDPGGPLPSQAELHLAAMDEQGNQSNVPTALSGSSPRQPPASKLRYETKIVLRGRTNRLVARSTIPSAARWPPARWTSRYPKPAGETVLGEGRSPPAPPAPISYSHKGF